MQTLNKFGYGIAHELGRATEYSFVELIKQRFKALMPLLLRRDSERNVPSLRRDALQSLYLTLESYNAVLDQVGLSSDPTIMLRSVQDIPAIITVHSHAPFNYVGNPNGQYGFTYTDYNNMRYAHCNEVGKEHIRYTYGDNRIYVFNSVMPKYIMIRHAFADPQSVEEVNQGSANCLTDNDILPYPADLVALAYQTILGSYQQAKDTNTQSYANSESGQG